MSATAPWRPRSEQPGLAAPLCPRQSTSLHSPQLAGCGRLQPSFDTCYLPLSVLSDLQVLQFTPTAQYYNSSCPWSRQLKGTLALNTCTSRALPAAQPARRQPQACSRRRYMALVSGSSGSRNSLRSSTSLLGSRSSRLLLPGSGCASSSSEQAAAPGPPPPRRHGPPGSSSGEAPPRRPLDRCACAGCDQAGRWGGGMGVQQQVGVSCGDRSAAVEPWPGVFRRAACEPYPR